MFRVGVHHLATSRSYSSVRVWADTLHAVKARIQIELRSRCISTKAAGAQLPLLIEMDEKGGRVCGRRGKRRGGKN